METKLVIRPVIILPAAIDGAETIETIPVDSFPHHAQPGVLVFPGLPNYRYVGEHHVSVILMHEKCPPISVFDASAEFVMDEKGISQLADVHPLDTVFLPLPGSYAVIYSVDYVPVALQMFDVCQRGEC